MYKQQVVILFWCVITFQILMNGAQVPPPTTSEPEAEHDYNIELKKAELKALNEEYIQDDFRISIEIFNDSLDVMESSMTFKKPLDSNTTDITVAGLEFSTKTNQWVKKFEKTDDFCDYIVTNHYFMDSIYRDSNLPRTCPYEAGEYYIRNMYMSRDGFPKHLEQGKWRINVIFKTKGGDKILEFDLVAKIAGVQPNVKVG